MRDTRQAVRELWRRTRSTGFVGGLAALVVSTGWFVRIEPAPYEYGMLLLLPLSIRVLTFPRPLLPTGILWGVFAFFSVLSLGWARDLLLGGVYLAKTLYLMTTGLLLVGILCRTGEGGARRLWGAYFVSALVGSWVAWLGMVGVPGFQWATFGGRAEIRALSGFKDPNVYAAFCLPAMLYGIDRLLHAKNSRVVLAWAGGVGLVGAGLVLAASRAAILGVLISCVLYALLTGLQAWRRTLQRGMGVHPQLRTGVRGRIGKVRERDRR